MDSVNVDLRENGLLGEQMHNQAVWRQLVRNRDIEKDAVEEEVLILGSMNNIFNIIIYWYTVDTISFHFAAIHFTPQHVCTVRVYTISCYRALPLYVGILKRPEFPVIMV